MGWEGIEEDILKLDAQMLALQDAAPPPPPEEPGLFTKYIKRPVFSALGKTQNLLTEPLFGETDAYKQAAAELEKSYEREPGAWEALPGMGDVAVQNFSPEFRQSTLGGRVVEPLARMAGNILGDPTTYVGGTILKGAGALGKGAVNAGRAAKAVEVARAGEAVGALPRIAEAGAAVGDLADAAHAAYYTSPAALDALEAGLKSHNRVRKYQATSELIRAGIEAGADPAVAKTYDFLAKAGMGADIAMLAATAVAGGPDIAVAASQAGKEAWQALEEGEYGKAGASATTAALMGGLGTLLAVGSIDSYKAVKALQQHVATTKPGLVPKMSQNAAEAAAAEQGVPPPRAPGEPTQLELPFEPPLRGAPPPAEPPRPEPRPPQGPEPVQLDLQFGSLEEAAAAARQQQMGQPGAGPPQLSNLPLAGATKSVEPVLQAIEPEAVAPPPLRTEPIVGAEGPVLNESAPSAAPVKWFHQDHSLQPEHLSAAEQALRDRGEGIHVVEVNVEKPLQSALYGPSVGDAPIPEAGVVRMKRGDRPEPSRMVNKPNRPTNIMTVIGKNNPDGTTEIYTAYGGKQAPREPWDRSLTPAEKAESEAFWAEHALATGEEAAPAPTASVAFMITRKMERALRTRGFTPEQINKMTPAQAQEVLAQKRVRISPLNPLKPADLPVDERPILGAPDLVRSQAELDKLPPLQDISPASAEVPGPARPAEPVAPEVAREPAPEVPAAEVVPAAEGERLPLIDKLKVLDEKDLGAGGGVRTRVADNFLADKPTQDEVHGLLESIANERGVRPEEVTHANIKATNLEPRLRTLMHRSLGGLQKEIREKAAREKLERRTTSSRVEPIPPPRDLTAAPEVDRERVRQEKAEKVRARQEKETALRERERAAARALGIGEETTNPRTQEAFTDEPLAPHHQKAMEEYAKWAVTAKGLPKGGASRRSGLYLDVAQDMIQKNVVYMGANKAWRKILDDAPNDPKAMEHAVNSLKAGLNNRVNEYFNRPKGKAERERMVPIEERHGVGGGRGGEKAPSIKAIEGLKAMDVADATKAYHEKAEDIVRKLHPKGGMLGTLMRMSENVLKGRTEDGRRIETLGGTGKRFDPTMLAKRLTLLHTLRMEHGDLSFAEAQPFLKQFESQIGKVGSNHYSSGIRLLKQIVDEQILPKGDKTTQRIESLAGYQKGPEAWFGVGGVEDELTISQAPRGADRPASSRLFVRRGRGQGENAVGRATGANGVWLDFVRGDEAAKGPMTHMNVVNVGGVGDKGVGEIAKVLRTLIDTNPSLQKIVVPLRRGDTGVVALSHDVDRALASLQKDGLLTKPTKPIVRMLGEELSPTVLEKGGRPEAVRGATTQLPKQFPPLESWVEGFGKRFPKDDRTNVYNIYKKWDEVHNMEVMARADPEWGAKHAADLKELRAEVAADYKKYADKWGPEAEALRAEWMWDKDKQAAAKWLADQKVDKVEVKLLDRVYEVEGREAPPTPSKRREILKAHAAESDETVGPTLAELRRVEDLDMVDTPVKVGDVVFVNLDETYTRPAQTRFAEAHAPMWSPLKQVHDEVSQALGLKTIFGGVVASPVRHGLLVGGAELGEGTMFLSPMGSYHYAGGDIAKAAEHLYDQTMMHEFTHAYWNSILHGTAHKDGMEALALRLARAEKGVKAEGHLQMPLVSGGERGRAGWIKALSDPALWKGIEEAYPEYRAAANRVKEEISGRDRAAGAGLEEAVGGVRAGTAEGRAAPVPDRLPTGAGGVEAGGGVRVQPIEPLPKGVRGEVGGLGEAPAVGRGGEQGRGERTPAEILARSKEDRRRVASSRANPSLRSIEEARRNFAELIGRRGAASELVRDGMQLASEMTRLLDDGKASDRALLKEWEGRVKSKPAGSGAEHSLVNSLWSQLSDAAKVRMSIYSELAAGNRDLRKLYSVHTPVSMDAIGAAGMDILGVRSPEELARMFEKGQKMSLAEQHALRIAATDVLHNHDLADKAWTKASAEWYLMPDGPAKDAFYDSKVAPLKADVEVAATKMNIVRAAVNLGTEKGRELALHKQMRLTSDILSQNYNQMREGLREFLRPRYPNKRELDGVINMLMERREALEKKPDWSSVGVVEWNKAYQKAFNFSNFDKFLQFYKAGLLGFPSRGANVLSNTIFVNGIRWQEKNLAAALEHAQAKWQGRAPEGFVQEIMLTPMVLRRGLSAAMKTWSKAQWDALTMKPIDYSSRSLDVSDDLIKIPSAIGGKLGEFISYIFKSMNADDGFFKHVVKVDHYYRKVFRNVMNGVDGYEVRPGETKYTATERIVGELEQNIRDAYDRGQKMEERFGDVHGEAQEMAQKDTFQEAMPGFMKSIQQTLYTGPGKGLQVPIPFVKTPFNIAKQVLLRTPVIGWGMDAAKWKEMTHAERMDATARHLTSATMAAGLIALTDGEEKLSGSGPMDPEANMLKQQTGWRPYSIKVGDKWISYQRLEPFSSLLGMLSDIQEGKRQGDFDKVDTATSRLLGSVAENITNKTFLSGFTNMTEAVSDPIRYMDRFLKSVETSLVPNTIGFLPFGHLAQAMDPVYREVSLNPLEVIKSKTPGLSQTLQPQYTPAGEIRKRPDVLGVPILSPIKYSTIRTDPVAKAAGVLSDIGFPMRRVRNEVDYKGVRVPLEPEEQKRLVKAQNDAMLFIGKQLINDPTFQRLPDNEDDADYPGQKTKKDVLARIVRRYRNPVMNSLNPLLRQRAATRLKGQRAADAGA